MLSNISWTEYWLMILMVALFYYIIIIVVYFKQELVGFFQNRILRKSISGFRAENSFPNNDSSEFSNDGLTSPISIESLQNEIRSKLEKARNAKSVRQEIIVSLQNVLRDYYPTERPTSRDSLNNYIRETCENLCSIHLEEREMKQLWVR